MARKLELVVNNTLTSDTPRGFCERHEVEPRKQCRGPCGQKKLRSEFHRSHATLDGIARICRACKSERNHDYYRDNIEWFRARDAALDGQVKRARRAARALKLVGMCEGCGRHPAAHRHHDCYDRPLDVRFLCGGCHSEWHKSYIPSHEDGVEPVRKIRPAPAWREAEEKRAA